jgi:hypothetical protein
LQQRPSFLGPLVEIARSGVELSHDGGCCLVRGSRRRVLHTAVCRTAVVSVEMLVER